MKYLILVLLSSCFVSCFKNDDPINRINKKLKIDPTGDFRKDIPEAYNDSSASWLYVRRETNRAGLPSIENGSESIEIRIWEHLDWGRRVFIIRYKDSTWTAEDCIYRIVPSGRDDIDSIAIDTSHLGNPKTGWNKFINKLIDKGILDLKDKSKIPGYSIQSEFLYLAVEIAAKNYYRYYSLPNARIQPSKTSDDKSMLEILDLIKKEFPEHLRKK